MTLCSEHKSKETSPRGVGRRGEVELQFDMKCALAMNFVGFSNKKSSLARRAVSPDGNFPPAAAVKSSRTIEAAEVAI